MDMTYLGAGCVRFSGRQISVLVDPFDDSAGLGKLKAAADVTLLTSPEVKGEPVGMKLDGPGEYEIKSSLINGVPARLHIDGPEAGLRGTIYSLSIDEVRVCVLGNVAADLSNDQISAIGSVDVLVVPVGVHGLTLDSTGAAQMVSKLEPKIVVPVHFDDGKTKYAMPQDDLKKFLEEMGSSPEPVSKLKLSAKELPEETTVAVLSRSGSA